MAIFNRRPQWWLAALPPAWYDNNPFNSQQIQNHQRSGTRYLIPHDGNFASSSRTLNEFKPRWMHIAKKLSGDPPLADIGDFGTVSHDGTAPSIVFTEKGSAGPSIRWGKHAIQFGGPHSHAIIFGVTYMKRKSTEKNQGKSYEIHPVKGFFGGIKDRDFCIQQYA